jgi:hypothetical protein
MGRRLNGYVPIHEDDGDVTWYGPDDEVPAAVAKKIGAHAWQSDDAADQDGPPPKSGRGATDAAWRAYAESVGVDTEDDAKKADIIAALEAADIPVE